MSLLKGTGLVLRGLSNLAFLGIPAGFVVSLLPHFDGAASYPWIMRIAELDAGMMERLRDFVPTQIGQLDLGRAFVLVGCLFVGLGLNSAANELLSLAAREDEKKKNRKAEEERVKRAEARRNFRKGPPAGAPAQKDSPSADEPKSREELVRLMVEAKRKLDAMTRDVAFLALDVVRSTEMKIGEDSAFVEHDFRQFRVMVDAAVNAHRPLKSAWTPDGAMICFDSLEDAVRAAKAMLKRLPDFNAGTRMMSTPFRVRCGVNSGRVQYDEATPMEAMSDSVIDIAGHMQKYAEPDSIFAAGELLSKRNITGGFVPAGTEVDGLTVFIWRGPSADEVNQPEAVSADPEASAGAPDAPEPKERDDTLLVSRSTAAPSKLGKYEIRRELGRGAMGVVYEAWDPSIQRRVALKTVRPDQLEGSDGEQLVQRFRREAQAAGRLSHPGIVSVYEFGQEADTSFIAMEFIEGEELQSWMDRGETLEVSQITEIMGQLLEALDAAGQEGVVHRDIKPSNILLLPDGRVKITDFGIAWFEASGLTQAGSVMGTPAYMSPEQLTGDGVDTRSDLFSAGVVLYQMLTGEKPFAGNRVATIIHKILESDPPTPSNLGEHVPSAFDSVINKAIAKSPDDRFQTGAEFAAAIRTAAEATDAATDAPAPE